MISLREQLIVRLKDATDRLEEAQARRDEYDSMLAAGEVESLVRIAEDHGLRLPGVDRLRDCPA